MTEKVKKSVQIPLYENNVAGSRQSAAPAGKVKRLFKYAMIFGIASCKIYFIKRDALALEEKLDQKIQQLKSIHDLDDLEDGIIGSCKPIACEMRDDFRLWLSVSRRYVAASTKERIERFM
ncbi:MAG: hypothetical protein ABH846_02185 [Patescibacteria group bacterium]